MLFDRNEGIIVEPGVRSIDLICFFAGVDLEPNNAALAGIRLLHGRIEDALRSPPDIGSGTVPFNKRNDGMIGHIELAVGDGDLRSRGGRGEFDILAHRWSCSFRSSYGAVDVSSDASG